MVKRILVADDEQYFLEWITNVLQRLGYEVITAEDGLEAIRTARNEKPDCIILDLVMPKVSGEEACEGLRHIPETSTIPIIVVTGKSRPIEWMSHLKVWINDYLTKPFEPEELRLKLERIFNVPVPDTKINPLTGLQGLREVKEEIDKRIKLHEHIAVGAFDIDNIKAFNQRYGYDRGDEVIQMMARLLLDAARNQRKGEVFVAHQGGDSFIFVCPPLILEPIAKDIIKTFDERVTFLYSKEDRERKYIELLDRRNNLIRYPIITISVVGVTNERRTLINSVQVFEVVAELRKFTKTRPEPKTSTFAKDRRSDNPPHK